MAKRRAHTALASSNRPRKLKFECPVCGHDFDFDFKLNQFGRFEWFYNCAACASRLSSAEFNAALRECDVWPSKIKAGDFSELRALGPPVARDGDPAPLPGIGPLGGWASALLSCDEPLDYLTCERGLSLETIREYELGWDRDAATITLPVCDAAGQIVNLRRRKLGKGHVFKGLYGRSVQLYPVGVLTGEGLLCVTEGEFDCLLVHQLGVRAVTGTGGAGTWMPEWTEAIRGHEVAVIYDVDAEARSAVLATQLREAGIDAWRVRLSHGGFRGKRDLTDVLVRSGKSRDWLLGLIRRERAV